jgi:hypothetical protein
MHVHLNNRSYMPTNSQVTSVGALAVVGFIAYAANLIGALTFLAVKMHKLHSTDGLAAYNKAYFVSRQVYYGVLTLLAGIVQLALGVYTQHQFGSNL